MRPWPFHSTTSLAVLLSLLTLSRGRTYSTIQVRDIAQKSYKLVWESRTWRFSVVSWPIYPVVTDFSTNVIANVQVGFSKIRAVWYYDYTSSSSAIAERPRNASCLSLVSFNSIVYASSAIFYDWLLRLQIYRCIQLNSARFSYLQRSPQCWLWCVAVCALYGRPVHPTVPGQKLAHAMTSHRNNRICIAHF